MIKSMTGFGRGDSQVGDKCFQVELKSVNHRYMDVSIKLPKKFTYLEESIRKVIKSNIQRGRIEAYITYESIGESDINVAVDMPLAKEYLKALLRIEEELAIKTDVTTSVIARFPDVIKVEKKEENEDEIWQCLQEALNNALNQLVIMRQEEGDKLQVDLLKRLNKTRDFVAQIKDRSPIIVQEYRQKLIERIKEILDEEFSLDDNRVAAEVALFADKSNITEEIVRLYSHINQFSNTLQEDDAIGRKLDFLLQEMNREANTIGSKANDLIIANLVINIKSEFEKMREQVQNIE
ncbi:YicC/YloC family endoribonuclease [Alkaliphilus sp. B6464]|uniref:YicC/YloC family endoribonuclease n=1 Tax=Alkaliphilus sp. B6464 TaxID=2731219 RepID=UPI001BA901BD|nr:YicC/YloC family endoribonuclease [Alkaliphilus sp. B6464]QUH20897.1 YicC family protein [Alkaliphilus sp. B6464]